MRHILLLTLIGLGGFSLPAQVTSLPAFFEKADSFFQKNVKNGLVDYQGLDSKPNELNTLYTSLAALKPDRKQANAYQAFWINAYNIAVIKGIVEEYPVQSPQSIAGFFDTKKHKVAGENLTLNEIENKKLRAEFNEPRFHFVLVCGALSCPPIIDMAYTPEDLNTLLQLQTIKALSDPDFIKVNAQKKEVAVSEIFKWYQEDFLKNSESIIRFINQYRDNKIPESYRLTYYTYNWALNDQLKSKASVPGTTGGSVIQEYTPSKLLKKGQWDLKNFNNFYSESRARFNGEEFDKPRENFFTSTFEAFHGVSDNARFNVGLIVNLKSTTRSNDSLAQGFFSPIAFQNESGISRAGIGSVAPSIRFVPFRKVSNFSVQTSFYFPLIENESENGVFLDRKSFWWDTRFYFDKSFWRKQFQIFTEVDLQYFFGEEGEGFANNSLGVPVSAFLSYFPASWFTVYVQAQRYFLIDLGNNFSQEFTQLGLGTKYQLNPVLNLELSYTNFVSGRDSGLGETANLGLRALF